MKHSIPARPNAQQRRSRPDPRALALAGELQALLPDAQVLLFGSRATGTWTSGSDIDLAVIGGRRDAAEAALERVRSRERNPYADCDHVPHGQIFHYAPAEFDELRTSRPHVVGQVQARGLTPDGEHLPPVVQDNPWPGIRNSLLICQRYLSRSITRYRGDEHGGANRYPELYEYVHQTLKTGLTVGLATAGADFAYTSDLRALAAQLPDDRAARLHDLLPPARLRELTATRFASDYEWDPGRRPWPSIDVGDLLAAVQQTCGWLAAEALEFTGKSPLRRGLRAVRQGAPRPVGCGRAARRLGIPAPRLLCRRRG